MDTITAATIEETMKTGRIVEARTLLTLHESALSTEECQALNRELEQQQAKAETMIAQAEALEISGKTEEAKALYESVLLLAVDFPDIHEQIKRLDEALLLTKAVKRRNQRIRETPSTPKQGTAGKRLLPLLGAGVAAGLAAAIIFLILAKPQPTLSPEKTSSEVQVPRASQQPVFAPATPAAMVTEKSQEVKTADPPVQEKILPETLVPVAAQKTVAASEAPAPPTFSPPEKVQNAKPVQAHPVQSSPPENIMAAEQEPSLPANNHRNRIDTYTVQSGDSLSLIAERQLCQEDLWRKIHQLNREQVTDPRKLQPGMVLRLNGIENRCPVTDQPVLKSQTGQKEGSEKNSTL
ncbi:LysM peptidoglycan-binding domain-containing protein [uncultured Desulfobulbus sp.]|uniref:LysM peptidoglycan-binding domain-containing protein n=1 Tax=uncultured Desulfobulbus sp. TaxID=239745 RepID=UPI0029C73068|nr:LysM peptidoglycan-binding domain-containing protein [uncultured Desulfobulbus sp.]